MAQTADHIGYEPRVWVDRLIDLSKNSKFTASERAFITQRLCEMRSDLDKSIPFVEGR